MVAGMAHAALSQLSVEAVQRLDSGTRLEQDIAQGRDLTLHPALLPARPRVQNSGSIRECEHSRSKRGLISRLRPSRTRFTAVVMLS